MCNALARLSSVDGLKIFWSLRNIVISALIAATSYWQSKNNRDRMSLSLATNIAWLQNRTVTEPRTRLAVAKPAPAGIVAAVPPKMFPCE